MSAQPTYHIGDTIRVAREAHGLSQKQLADKIGVSQGAVNWWETGRANPKIDKVSALAETLDVPASLLVERVGDVPLHPDAVELAVRATLLDDRTRRALLAYVDAYLAGRE